VRCQGKKSPLVAGGDDAVWLSVDAKKAQNIVGYHGGGDTVIWAHLVVRAHIPEYDLNSADGASVCGHLLACFEDTLHLALAHFLAGFAHNNQLAGTFDVGAHAQAELMALSVEPLTTDGS
jgi:hypothetical protein